MSTRRTWTYAAIAAMPLAAWLWQDGPQAWLVMLDWVRAAQHELHRQLTAAVGAAAQGGGTAGWALIGLSLVYGVLHAVGPGHGKAVIATYLGSSPVLLRRGIMLSIVSALVQGVTAIVIVEVTAGLLGLSMRRVQATGMQLENASYVLMALVGAVLALRSAMALWRLHGAAGREANGRKGREGPHEPEAADGAPRLGSLFSSGRRMQIYCMECGAAHGPSRRHIEQPLSLRTAAALVAAIGLRPCAGALLVLLGAYALDMRWAGRGAVLAMSLGTAAAMAVLAAVTVYARQRALRFFRGAGDSRRAAAALGALGLAGGLLVLALGIGLLDQQGAQPGPHPLLAF